MLAFKQKAKYRTSAFPITVLYRIFSIKLPQTEYLEFKVTVLGRLIITPFCYQRPCIYEAGVVPLLMNVLNCSLVFVGHDFVTLYWVQLGNLW